MLSSILKLFSLDSRCLLQSKTAPLILINLGFHGFPTFTGVMFTNLGQTRIDTVMHRVSLVKSLREATYERRQSNKKKLSRSRLQQLAGEDYRVNAGFVAKVVPELDSVIISQPAETSWIRLHGDWITGSTGPLIEIFDCWSTCSYGRLWVITSYFYGVIHSINRVSWVLITGISGHNCRYEKLDLLQILQHQGTCLWSTYQDQKVLSWLRLDEIKLFYTKFPTVGYVYLFYTWFSCILQYLSIITKNILLLPPCFSISHYFSNMFPWF